MREISPDQLAEAVGSILESYKKEVIEASAEAVKASAVDCKNSIKRNVDRADIQGTGEYKESWTAELELQTPTETVYRVYAKAPYYRLTHLLEKGHEKWYFGHHIGGRTRAFAHIRPAVNEMKKNFAAKLKVGMKK